MLGEINEAEETEVVVVVGEVLELYKGREVEMRNRARMLWLLWEEIMMERWW